jgi:hypothetical protein
MFAIKGFELKYMKWNDRVEIDQGSFYNRFILKIIMAALSIACCCSEQTEAALFVCSI